MSPRWPGHLSPAERDALRRFVERARERLGPDLLELRLFGSRARGEGHEESDLDIAAIVTPGTRARRHELTDLAWDLMLETGLQISPLALEEPQLRELRARELRIARDIDTEGIPL
jgi:predicted nucleotidyltransferase